MNAVRHFAAHARDYARSRPDYPAALFDWLAAQTPRHELAWDCGCGSGQASGPLADRFERVVATDRAPEQIAHARPSGRVLFGVAAAEQSPLADACCDLITVAQALHWLDVERFYAEARRVLRQGAVLGVWTYQLLRFEDDAEVQSAFTDFYRRELAPWWPSQRRHVDEGYRSLPFPFAELCPPAFEIRRQWTLGDFLSYVGTWSSVQKRLSAGAGNATIELGAVLRNYWKENAALNIAWPIAMRVGRKQGGGIAAASPI